MYKFIPPTLPEKYPEEFQGKNSHPNKLLYLIDAYISYEVNQIDVHQILEIYLVIQNIILLTILAI